MLDVYVIHCRAHTQVFFAVSVAAGRMTWFTARDQTATVSNDYDVVAGMNVRRWAMRARHFGYPYLTRPVVRYPYPIRIGAAVRAGRPTGLP